MQGTDGLFHATSIIRQVEPLSYHNCIPYTIAICDWNGDPFIKSKQANHDNSPIWGVSSFNWDGVTKMTDINNPTNNQSTIIPTHDDSIFDTPTIVKELSPVDKDLSSIDSLSFKYSPIFDPTNDPNMTDMDTGSMHHDSPGDFNNTVDLAANNLPPKLDILLPLHEPALILINGIPKKGRYNLCCQGVDGSTTALTAIMLGQLNATTTLNLSKIFIKLP